MSGRHGLKLIFRIAGFAAVAWLAGLIWFVDGFERPPADADQVTDAIVVLTGGSQRVESGLALLLDGKAKKLFVSGVHPGVARHDMFPGRTDAERWIECCVVLGHAADNTEGNAIETAEWLRQEGYHSLRLVTANYHMRRALLEFRRVLPPEDLIVPDPVVPDTTHGRDWLWRSVMRVVVIEYVKYLGALARSFVESPSLLRAASQGTA